MFDRQLDSFSIISPRQVCSITFTLISDHKIP